MSNRANTTVRPLVYVTILLLGVFPCCVQNLYGPVTSLAVLFPEPAMTSDASFPGLSSQVQPTNTITIAVQARNSSNNPVNGVQIFFVAQTPNLLQFPDYLTQSTPPTITTGFNEAFGNGVAIIRIQPVPGASYGAGSVIAALTLWDPAPDASSSNPQAFAVNIPIAVVPNLMSAKLAPFPSAPVTMHSTAQQTISVQAVDDGGTPIDTESMFAEVYPANAGLALVDPSGGSVSSTSSITMRRTVSGLAVDGVAQWTLAATVIPDGGANEQFNVEYGLVNASGENSQVGSFGVTVTP